MKNLWHSSITLKRIIRSSSNTLLTGGSDNQRTLNQREYGAFMHRIASHKGDALRPPPMTEVLLQAEFIS